MLVLASTSLLFSHMLLRTAVAGITSYLPLCCVFFPVRVVPLPNTRRRGTVAAAAVTIRDPPPPLLLLSISVPAPLPPPHCCRRRGVLCCSVSFVRFGKFTQLQFDGDFRMSGSGCTTYLLEKSRVVGHEPGERAYHVFYQAREGPSVFICLACSVPAQRKCSAFCVA